MSQVNDCLKSYDVELGESILRVLSHMVSSGEMLWTRHQVLHSDEAARAVIARLPEKFRSIDCNHFRRIADPLEKRSANRGGFPRFTTHDIGQSEERLVNKIDAWAESRTHQHSEEYDRLMQDPMYAEWKARIKRIKGYQCAACGIITTGNMLEIHHYTYDRLGHESDDDVCCVCSPHTGRRCHALLDLARIVADNPDEPLYMFDPKRDGWVDRNGQP